MESKGAQQLPSLSPDKTPFKRNCCHAHVAKTNQINANPGGGCVLAKQNIRAQMKRLPTDGCRFRSIPNN